GLLLPPFDPLQDVLLDLGAEPGELAHLAGPGGALESVDVGDAQPLVEQERSLRTDLRDRHEVGYPGGQRLRQLVEVLDPPGPQVLLDLFGQARADPADLPELPP